MFRRLATLSIAVVLVAGSAIEAAARNPAYYGTSRHTSARAYSGQHQAHQPNVVPTFSLPVYGNGFRTYYRGGGYRGRGYYGRGYYAVYPQPVVVYPPVVYYGF